MKLPARPDLALLVAHVLLWVFFLLPTAPYHFKHLTPGHALAVIGMQGLYLSIAVYSNQLYFLPRFFFTGRRLLYLLLTLGALLPYTWVGTWLFDQFVHDKPPVTYFMTRFYTLSFAFGFIDQYMRRQKAQNWQLQVEGQQTRLELERLKAQVNPHFLFNTLHNLYVLTLKQSPQAPNVVLGLANLMRYLFTTSHLDYVPLGEEATYIEQYMKLERLRLSTDRAVITFLAQGITPRVSLPPMLLIPFVENAFKHGVETDTGRVFVAVTLAVQDREVFFEVENSKPPAGRYAPNSGPPTSGTGLANIRQRLALLFPDRHRLTIDDQPLTYKITLALQL